MEKSPPEVWPLASFLAEEMNARKWTCTDVALNMPGDYTHNIFMINILLVIDAEKVSLKDDDFEKLAAAFNVSSAYFRNLHKLWKMHPEARQPFDCPEHLLDGLEFPANDLSWTH